MVRLSEQTAKYLDAIVVQQPFLTTHWPSLADRMHYVPDWPRGKLLTRAQASDLTKRPSSDGRYVLMAGEQGRDFATGLAACKIAGLHVRLVTPETIVAKSEIRCVDADGCTLTTHLDYEEFMQVVENAWVVVIPLLPNRRLGSGSRLVGEALSRGVPGVVSSYDGAAAAGDPWQGVVESERNGLVIKPGSVDELAGALKRLKLEKGLRDRLVSGAQADAVSYYSLEAIGERLQVSALTHHTAPPPPAPPPAHLPCIFRSAELLRARRCGMS